MSKYNDVKVAFIGGSGLYRLDTLKPVDEIEPETPWGKPSSKIVICETEAGNHVAFLARHGIGHHLNPSEVPARANIAALKSIGVEAIIAFSAVGSLREEIKPRDFVLPSQIIDRTKGIRPSTFFENGCAAHIAFGEPFNKDLADIIYAQKSTLQGDNVEMHRDKCLICMEGPAFSTRAESNMYRMLGGDIINMSVLPEAKLAMEAEIAYQMICMATDYDSWRVSEEVVTVETVIANLNANTSNANQLAVKILPALEEALYENKIELPKVKALKGSMKFASITAKEARNPEAVNKLNFILPGYF